MAEAAIAHHDDEPPSLRRTLDRLPRGVAQAAERDLLDAVDHYHRTRDDGPLLRAVLGIVSAGLEASPEFREAVAQLDREPVVDPQPIDHQALMRELRG